MNRKFSEKDFFIVCLLCFWLEPDRNRLWKRGYTVKSATETIETLSKIRVLPMLELHTGSRWEQTGSREPYRGKYNVDKNG